MKYKKLTFKSSSNKPHDFIGSKIRGTLGYILKDEVCINPSFECKDCFASKDCLFYAMYEDSNITHKYRLDFDLGDDKFEFSLLLFEDFIRYSQKITMALLESLKEYENIEVSEQNLELEDNNFCPIVKIEFLTPLRMKSNNIIAKKSIELLEILSSINKRYYDIIGEEYQKLDISTDYKVISSHFNYKQTIRKSNRQKRKMDFGGLIGDMVVNNIDKRSYDLLKIGEIIGVGKNTVFGLGNIKVEDIN